MNALGIALVWCVAQVTLIGLLCGGLYWSVRRLRPAAAAPVAMTGLLVVVVLSALALSPWPRWKLPASERESAADTADAGLASLSAVEEADEARPGTAEQLPPPAESGVRPEPPGAGAGPAAPALLWRALVDELARPRPGAPDAGWQWPAVAAVLLLAGATTGIAWLLGGLLAVRSYRLRSRAVEDAALGELADVVRAELGCRRPIEIRQSDDLVTAATIGWRRPVVLLPADWTAWTEAQRRAVLAHEIAHVCRNDFLAVVCGQLGLALHFYHPLVHWLMGRLRLEQELAADAAAARVSGGQHEYLAAIAELALAQQDRPLAWPARSFLPTRNAFVRRIVMLRDSRLRFDRLSPAIRVSVVGAVVLCGLLVAGLRGPGVQREGFAEDAGPASWAGSAPPVSGSPLPAATIDLTDIPADAPPVATTQETPREVRGMGGGSRLAERAVAAGLHWLARHQEPDGHWSLSAYTKQCKDKTCTGGGTARTDSGATALALLPFLGAGQNHEAKGPYREVVHKGLLWLMKNQAADGNLGGDAAYLMYSHGLATLALCEAHGSAKDKTVGERAQVAVDFIQRAQHPVTGGWRYQPGDEGDTSVLGCQLAALESARRVGLKVDPKALEGARKWLKSVAQGDRKALFSYRPESGVSPSMTAVGMLCSQRLGLKPDDPAIAEGVAYLNKNAPDAASRDCYYWCYATQVMHNVPGPDWDNWNRKMRRVLIETQIKEGCATGSWDPRKPTPDRWGDQGGRIMVTSLSCLTLEVYYRYLRVYQSAEAKAQAANNLKQIALAMHVYHDTYKHLPPSRLYGPDGKTPYSWRVAMLPFLDQNDLYKKYRFDEPWDGPNNRKLLEKIPAQYRSPNAPVGSTNAAYFVLVGPGTVSEVVSTPSPPAQGKPASSLPEAGIGAAAPGGPARRTPGEISFADITDGTSNTLMVVEAKRDIPWTKPEDIPYDPQKPIPELGGFDEGGFHGAMCDGSVRFFRKAMPEETLRRLIDRADGRPIDWDSINKQ